MVLTWKPLPGYTGPYMVRLHDTQWNGQQAPGFQHDCKVHYVCVITTATQLSVPVRPGGEYQWWVHKPYYDAAKASFTVDRQATPPQSPDVPVLVGPLHGTTVNSSSVTLEFKPLPGYSGPYMVRLHDSQWNGQQAPGFQHDSTSALPECHHQFHACHRAGPPWSRIQVVGPQTVFPCRASRLLRRQGECSATGVAKRPRRCRTAPRRHGRHHVGDVRVPAAARLHGQIPGAAG